MGALFSPHWFVCVSLESFVKQIELKLLGSHSHICSDCLRPHLTPFSSLFRSMFTIHCLLHGWQLFHATLHSLSQWLPCFPWKRSETDAVAWTSTWKRGSKKPSFAPTLQWPLTLFTFYEFNTTRRSRARALTQITWIKWHIRCWWVVQRSDHLFAAIVAIGDCQPVLWAVDTVKSVFRCRKMFRLQYIRSVIAPMFTSVIKCSPKTHKNASHRALIVDNGIFVVDVVSFDFIFSPILCTLIVSVVDCQLCMSLCLFSMLLGGGNVFAPHRRRWKLKRCHFKRKIHWLLCTAYAFHLPNSATTRGKKKVIPKSCARHWRENCQRPGRQTHDNDCAHIPKFVQWNAIFGGSAASQLAANNAPQQ